MSPRRTSLLVWSLAVVNVALYLASVPLYVLAHPGPLSSAITVSLAGALFLVFPVVGTMIASRRPRSPIGWILLADGLLWNLSGMMDYYTDYGTARPGTLPFVVGLATINNWLWVPAAGLLGTFAFLLFPDGRLPSRRWHPLAWLSGLTIVLVSIMVAVTPGPFQGLEGVCNPMGVLAFPAGARIFVAARAGERNVNEVL